MAAITVESMDDCWMLICCEDSVGDGVLCEKRIL